jgi:hypothetical protein
MTLGKRRSPLRLIDDPQNGLLVASSLSAKVHLALQKSHPNVQSAIASSLASAEDQFAQLREASPHPATQKLCFRWRACEPQLFWQPTTRKKDSYTSKHEKSIMRRQLLAMHSKHEKLPFCPKWSQHSGWVSVQ